MDHKVSLRDVLTPPQLNVLEQHLQMKPLYESSTGVYITDISKSATHVSSGPLVPTMLKGSMMLALIGDEVIPFTLREQLLIMGEAVYPELFGDDYTCLWLDTLESGRISPNQVRGLAGNAMHLASLGLFQLYCLSRLSLIDGPA